MDTLRFPFFRYRLISWIRLANICAFCLSLKRLFGMKRYNHFSPDEFERCTPSCSIEQMDEHFMGALECVRIDAGVPFVLNSAYRSSEYDKARRRSGCGYHTLGRAVDVKCIESVSRAKIIRAALVNGFSVGVSNTFIHLDNRPNQIVFLYK